MSVSSLSRRSLLRKDSGTDTSPPTLARERQPALGTVEPARGKLGDRSGGLSHDVTCKVFLRNGRSLRRSTKSNPAGIGE
jgi:hypothetical protein